MSSWYADIAYKRGYIREDVNQDGFLDKTERMHTNSFNAMQTQFYGGTNNKEVILNNVRTYTKYFEMMPYGSSLSSSLVNKYSSSSIEEELNKMLQLDDKANGFVRLNQLGSGKEYAKYLDEIIGPQKEAIDNSYTKEDQATEIMKRTKEDLKRALKEAGITKKSIEADASIKEVMDEIMESPQHTKDFLEKSQNQGNEDPLFTQMQQLTKLDKQTLQKNLENNHNFEEDMIAIVQEIKEIVDRQYRLQILDIKA